MINKFKIYRNDDAATATATETINSSENNADKIEVVSEINLDAMTEPEGSQVIYENTGSSNLKNLDKEMDEAGKANPAVETTKATTTTTTETTPAATNKNNNAAPYLKPFEDLRTRLGVEQKDFKMPEGLTEENYFDKLLETIYENTDFPQEQELHPEISKINDLVKQGVPFEKAISEYNKLNDINNLEPKELVELSLKQSFGKSESNPNGWDDEKIKTTLDKMEQSGYLDIEAEKIRSNYNTQKKSIAENLSKQHLDQVKLDNEKVNATRQEQVQKSLDYLNTLNDVYGVPLSKSEIAEFKDDFKYLTTPDETGTSPLIKLLQSNENLVKVAYMLKKGDAKVKQALTEAKEKAKASIINKLDPEPELLRKTSSNDDFGQVDLDKLAMPEQYR